MEELVAAYRADLQAAGMFAGHPVTSVARSFFTRVGVHGWSRLPLPQQCTLPLKDRRVVGWLIVTGRVHPARTTWSPAGPTWVKSPPVTTGSSTSSSARPPPSSGSARS